MKKSKDFKNRKDVMDFLDKEYKKSKPNLIPDQICTRCGAWQSMAARKTCHTINGKNYATHSFQDPAQAKFESTLRKKGDEELDRVKRKAKIIDWEALYKVQKEETHEVYKKLHEAEDKLEPELARNKKLKKIIWSIVVGVIIIGYLILR